MAIQRYPLMLRLIHLGLVIFGITAFLSGELAEEESQLWGYLIHAYLGLALTVFVASRFMLGLVGPRQSKFVTWVPFTRARFAVVIDDVKQLLHFKLPEHRQHEGLSALVHVFGLLLFLWMGVTGTVLYFIGDYEATLLGEFMAEIHEVGESLIPLFLLLHIGAVVLHTLLGHSILKRMFSFGNRSAEVKINYVEHGQNH